MDDQTLIGYQLQRYHHIQNQAAKILGLILTLISTTIALISAILFNVISIPNSIEDLILRYTADNFTNVTLAYNSLIIFTSSLAIFVLAVYIYTIILFESNISPEIKSVTKLNLNQRSDKATVVNNRISLHELENLWQKSSKHIAIAVGGLFLGLISISYSIIPNQLMVISIHLSIILIPIVLSLIVYFDKGLRHRIFDQALEADFFTVYIITATLYLFAVLISIVSVWSVLPIY